MRQRAWGLIGWMSLLLAASPVFAEEEGGEPVDNKAKYHVLKPHFVTNLSARDGRNAYVRVQVGLMSKQAAVIDSVKAHEPQIRNQIILLLGDTRRAAMQSPRGRQQLAIDALQRTQTILAKEGNKGKIEKVLFMDVIVE